jgi:hypothetical protein
MIDVKGAKKLSSKATGSSKLSSVLDPIVEENAEGKNSSQIYVDPEDPKKKKYDELKRKALLVTQRKNKQSSSGYSDTSSVISDSKSEKSDITLSSMRSGTSSQ